MPIVSASRDSKVGGEGVDKESDQKGEYDSCMESDDECVILSSDEDVGTPFSIELCTCVGHAHSRSCPLNSRNKALPSSSPKSMPMMPMRVHHRLTSCQWGHQYRQRYASVVLPHTSEPPLNFVL